FVKPYHVLIPTLQEWENEPKDAREDQAWYTDGSKTATGTGIGIFCHAPRTKLSLSLGKYVTIFQAEVQAIERCATMNVERGIKNQTSHIYSDSQAALKAIDNCQVSSNAVKQCKNILKSLSQDNHVKLTW